MTPPPSTPEQRAAAKAKAARTREKRSKIKEQLRQGDASLTDVLGEGQADPDIGNMRVLDLLASLPGMDKASATGIMKGLGIAGTRRLGSLSPTEQAALMRTFSAPGTTSSPVEEPSPWWRKWGGKLAVSVAAVIVAALGTLLGVWLVFFAGPPAPSPSASPIGNPGHPPGRQDVSTLSPNHRFYAVANFFYFPHCGRPCYLPLYPQPTESSAGITRGWPCEYYNPNSPNGPYCLRPPTGRRPSEMANQANKYSGDRILVICQTTHLANGQAAQIIHNEAGQGSRIWDMVAVPVKRITYNGVVTSHLRHVPGMKGLYEAYAPDLWLGNTGWHGIPCK
jgi:hypothetical protein